MLRTKQRIQEKWNLHFRYLLTKQLSIDCLAIFKFFPTNLINFLKNYRSRIELEPWFEVSTSCPPQLLKLLLDVAFWSVSKSAGNVIVRGNEALSVATRWAIHVLNVPLPEGEWIRGGTPVCQ